MYNKIIKAVIVIAIASGMVTAGCSDFLTGEKLDTDPNRAVSVSINQSFTAVQAAMFLQFTGHLARTTSIWMEQMSGTDRQLLSLGEYVYTEDDYDNEFDAWYTGGGLIDIRRVWTDAEAGGHRLFAGIAKVWEAFMMGTAASLWGDIPYSEAISDVETPKLDSQADVYAAVQVLLDDAIADLQDGSGINPGDNDFVYGGDATKWIEAAHSLKARFYMHWAEVSSSNYASALTQAQMGISSVDNNFAALHSSSTVESNIWYQFNRDRSGYMRSGWYTVDLLDSRNDPRMSIYFAKDAGGNYLGSKPGDGNTDASNLSSGFLDPARDTDLVSWEETQFIIAEAQYKTGSGDAARTTLNTIMAGLEARWDLDTESLPRYDSSVTGSDLLEAIMTEKYLALFLNIEIYNDWKRTNIPDDLVGPGIVGKPIPRTLYYSGSERNANPNIPTPSNKPIRNANDPG